MNSYLWFAAFLLFSFVFSSSEMSFVASDKLFVKIRAKSSRAYKSLHYLLSNPKVYLYSVLVGNNVANTALTLIAEGALLKDESVSSSLILSLIVSGFVLVFGEILPKAIASSFPEKMAVIYAPLIRILYYLFYPVIVISSSAAELAMRIMKRRSAREDEQHLTPSDIEQLLLSNVDVSAADYESRMLKGIFRFSDKTVSESMIPRRDAVFVNANDDVQRVRRKIASGKKIFTRYPVCENSEDEVTGVMNVNDLAAENPLKVKQILRKILFFPETLTLDLALIEMKKNKVHMAAVIDEYGGVAGIVTFEDIIEELIGDISDEYDSEEHVRETNGRIIIDGDERIEEVNEKFNLRLPLSSGYETLSGLLMSRLGRIPEENDVATFKNICKIRVLSVKHFSVKKAEIERINENEE